MLAVRGTFCALARLLEVRHRRSREPWSVPGGSLKVLEAGGWGLVGDLARKRSIGLKTLFMAVCGYDARVLKAPRKQDDAQKRKIKPVETNF